MFPVAGFWLLLAFGPSLWLLYLGRALLATSAAVVYTILNPLLAELYPARCRGLAGIFPKVIGCAGMLLSYLLAYFLSWDMATAVSAAPFLPLPFMLLFVPEVCRSYCKSTIMGYINLIGLNWTLPNYRIYKADNYNLSAVPILVGEEEKGGRSREIFKTYFATRQRCGRRTECN